MVFPVIGGGIIRLRAGEQEWDIANPTFNPRASIPRINLTYGAGRGDEYVSGPSGIENQRVPDEVLINAYQRTHRGFIGVRGNEIEQRRQQRIANFDLSEAVPTPPAQIENGLTPAHPAHPPRINVITGNQRPIEADFGRPPAQVQAEERRQARLNQIRQASDQRIGGIEGDQPPVNPVLIGIDPAYQGTSSVNIFTTVNRKPKAPPKTRFERVRENIEESNEPEK